MPESMSGDQEQKEPLCEGDPVVFVDTRRRELYGVLKAGQKSGIRGDLVAHDEVLGRPSGCRVMSRKRRPFRVFRATLQQHVLNMQRHATIVYPKDIGPLLVHADIFPGARVVEGGFGSGALSMALLRAIGADGELITYEWREESANRAGKNVAALLGETPNHVVRLGDITEAIEETEVDRVVLDIPEPWRVLAHAADALKDGGILAAYVPTVIQVQRLMQAFREKPVFYMSWCIETLERFWHVTPESCRPHQQMVGHTGFYCFARRSAREFDRYPPREAPGDAAATD